MRLKVTKKFTFDSAHHLTKYYGKCENPHGHTYTLLVAISGEVDDYYFGSNLFQVLVCRGVFDEVAKSLQVV